MFSPLVTQACGTIGYLGYPHFPAKKKLSFIGVEGQVVQKQNQF